MKNNIKKILISQLGVSLVELLISVAMMGGVALTVTELMRQNAQVTSKTRTRFDESEFIMMLHAKLSQPTICEKNFPVGSDAEKVSFTADKILDIDDTVLAEIGTEYGDNQDLVISALSSTHVAGTPWIKVNIAFTKNKTNLTAKEITRSLLLFAEVDGAGKVKRCLGSSLSVEDSGWDLACTNNTSVNGRNVMIEMTDPDDPAQTICVKKALNVEGCGLLSAEFANTFEYNSDTKLYDFGCVGGLSSTLCSPYFMMRYASDGTAICDPISELQAYQPFNETDDSGTFVSGPATVDCTGLPFAGLQNISDRIRVMCGAGPANTPTPTATPTETPTPAATATPGTCSCKSVSALDTVYSLAVTRDMIPDNSSVKAYIVLDSDCDGGPPSTAWTEGPSCTISSHDSYLTCGVEITNVGGTGGTYSLVQHSIYPQTGTTIKTADCGTSLYSGAMTAKDVIYVEVRIDPSGVLYCNNTAASFALISPWRNTGYMSTFNPAIWFNSTNPVVQMCSRGISTSLSVGH